MNKQIFFKIALLVLSKCALCATEDPIVKTPLGPIKGRYIKSYEGRTVAAFEGIPYAKPPVGDLRFKEPQPIDPWVDILLANKTYVCIQFSYLTITKGDEDCLYLYVYVPREKINADEKLDVLVHIHGGGFIIGDPRSLSGPEYIMDRDLIYVNMNYRLGISGFLSTGDDVVPGNNGLKDQSLALKWVKENIEYFGGNPNSITLTGMSAGAASAHYHYFSPLSKGLFHRGHSQSGTTLNPWALTKTPLENAQRLAKTFDCSTDTSEELVKCLRGIPVTNITAALRNFFEHDGILSSNAFAPVIEPNHTNAFLTEHPYKLLMDGRFNDVPWITSNTKDEGIIPVGFFVMFRKLPDIENQWNQVLPYSLAYYDIVDEKDKISVAEALKNHYMNNESLSMDNVLNFIKLHTDRLFISGAENAIRLQAKTGKSPVYYYYFDYLIHIPLFFKVNLPVVGHGDDSILLYRSQLNPKVLQNDDNEMRKVFLDFTFNYASKGIVKFKNIEWKPVSSSEEVDYMHISSPNDIRAEQTKEIGSTSFWNSLPFKENAHLFN